nr:hypothetical protein [Thalassotalea sp. LPB0316]
MNPEQDAQDAAQAIEARYPEAENVFDEATNNTETKPVQVAEQVAPATPEKVEGAEAKDAAAVAEEIQQDLPFVEQEKADSVEQESTDETVTVEQVVERAEQASQEVQQEIDFSQTAESKATVEQTDTESEQQAAPAEVAKEAEPKQVEVEVETQSAVQETKTPVNGSTSYYVALSNKTSGKASAQMAKPAAIELVESTFEIVAMQADARASVKRSEKAAGRAFATSSSSAGPTKP